MIRAHHMATCVLSVLAACAHLPPPDRPAPVLTLAETWTAPLPHAGQPAKLKDWWASWGDSTLLDLIDTAQRESPTLTAARARILQARASLAGIQSSRLPEASLNASERWSGSPDLPGNFPVTTRSLGISIDASWEVDLFGTGRLASSVASAVARAKARTLDWHDARVSLAADIATSYVNLRTCEVLLIGFERDASSRAETARLIDLKAKAGFTAPAEAALTQASVAEARARTMQQRATCDIEIKVLSQLTALAEPALRTKLATNAARLPAPQSLAIERVPARSLAQRPDIAAAEAELHAAAADIAVADADRYPRISLTGALGYVGLPENGKSWSFGPAISLPIFDAGRRIANVEHARARYAEAQAHFQERAARAVREVEEALVRLASANAREADTRSAQQGFETFAAAAEAKVRAGVGSVVELEEARRAVVAAQGASINLERERLTAWASLYRAVGGGWQNDAVDEAIPITKQISTPRNAS